MMIKKWFFVTLALFIHFRLETQCQNGNKSETVLYLVRHGETDWNVEKRIQGQSDIALNNRGRQQAATLAKKLQAISFDMCFSSDLQRAYETAKIAITDRTLTIQQDKRLRERNFGRWEGHLSEEFCRITPEEAFDVESNEAIRQRAFSFLQDVCKDHQGKTILIVTHGGVMRAILASIGKLDCDPDEIVTKNTSCAKLIFSDGMWRIDDLDEVVLPQPKGHIVAAL